jgi:alpha-L-fucosidase 2
LAITWKVNLWARLRDRDRAHRRLSNQLRFTEEMKTVMADAGGTYPNLFDAHPPFQIDGSFGVVSGMTEMLLQSHERYTYPKAGAESYVINLLPALPKAWPNGSVKGLCARGGFTVNIAWRDGKPTAAEVHSLNGGLAQVRYDGAKRETQLEKGGAFRWGIH